MNLCFVRLMRLCRFLDLRDFFMQSQAVGISKFSFGVLQECRREDKRVPWQVVCVESVCRHCSHAGNTNWPFVLVPWTAADPDAAVNNTY